MKVQLVTHSIIPNLNSGLVPIDPIGLVFIFKIRCKMQQIVNNTINSIITGGKLFRIDQRYSVTSSCILHLHSPQLAPSITILVFQDVPALVTTIRSSCNTGQYYEGAVNIIICLHSPNSRTLLSTVIILIPVIRLGSLAEVISCHTSEPGLSTSVESRWFQSSS